MIDTKEHKKRLDEAIKHFSEAAARELPPIIESIREQARNLKRYAKA